MFRKYHRGTIVGRRQAWVVGGICRETSNFLPILKKKNIKKIVFRGDIPCSCSKKQERQTHPGEDHLRQRGDRDHHLHSTQMAGAATRIWSPMATSGILLTTQKNLSSN